MAGDEESAAPLIDCLRHRLHYLNFRVLDDAKLEQEFGLKIMDMGARATLDLRGIKIKATGVWKCALLLDGRPVSPALQ